MVNQDASWMFAQYSNLKTVNIDKFDTSQVKNMFALFYQDGKLENVDVSHFDTSNVTTMEYLFNGCKSLT